MPPGCVQCASGEWQCGSDTTELCAAGGGWNPAGALCLQFFVRKHPKTGNCLIRVQPFLLDECGGTQVVMGDVPILIQKPATPRKKAKARRKS